MQTLYRDIDTLYVSNSHLDAFLERFTHLNKNGKLIEHIVNNAYDALHLARYDKEKDNNFNFLSLMKKVLCQGFVNVAVLYAEVIDEKNRWTIQDDGSKISLDSWVAEKENIHDILLLQVPNPYNFTLTPQKGIVIYPTADIVSLLDYREASPSVMMSPWWKKVINSKEDWNCDKGSFLNTVDFLE